MDYLKQNFIFVKDIDGKDKFIRIDSIKEIIKRADGKAAMLIVHSKNNGSACSFQSTFEETITQLTEI